MAPQWPLVSLRSGVIVKPAGVQNSGGSDGKPAFRHRIPLLNPEMLCSWFFKHFLASYITFSDGVRHGFVPRLVPRFLTNSHRQSWQVGIENNAERNFKELTEIARNAEALKRNNPEQMGILIGPSMAPRSFEVPKIPSSCFFGPPAMARKSASGLNSAARMASRWPGLFAVSETQLEWCAPQEQQHKGSVHEKEEAMASAHHDRLWTI